MRTDLYAAAAMDEDASVRPLPATECEGPDPLRASCEQVMAGI
ncbi:hypothetical protein [Streptomyces decoyicus]